MNFSSFFGVLLGLGIVGASIHESGMDAKFFLNFHGVVIVCGGTMAAASIMFPVSKLVALLKVFFLRVLGTHRNEYHQVIEQILDLNKKASIGGVTALNDMLPGIRHPFLREAVSLVAGGVLSEREIRDALEQRIKTVEHRYMYEANMFRAIGKFPPAFGLLATTLGMIALLQQLGKPGAEAMIGPAMSIGLVGTLYGIAIANFVFLPIAENLTVRTEEEVALRRMVVEGCVMLRSQTNPISMRETLNSFVLPKDRVVRKAA
ncbi:MAG: MotA/TolQ/ExbB proton channel family protein [Bdellovibrionales bacterium]|nr:MotA/TolQ/ExbB proton channel family protein [Bdellovibrionales bacterium]